MVGALERSEKRGVREGDAENGVGGKGERGRRNVYPGKYIEVHQGMCHGGDIGGKALGFRDLGWMDAAVYALPRSLSALHQMTQHLMTTQTSLTQQQPQRATKK